MGSAGVIGLGLGLLACSFGGGRWRAASPKKRYKHVRVRLGSAIPGSAHFWEKPPANAIRYRDNA